MIWILYNLLFPVAFLFMLPKFLLRMARRGGYRRHFEQRIGLYGRSTTSRLTDRRRTWIHAVSVGELFVALRFIEECRKNNPEAFFVLSTNTSTGHALAEEKLDSRDVLIYFPVDVPFVMNRVLKIICPVKLILVECEFWPNLIRLAHRREIPVALINGRISDSSYRGYRLIRPFVRRILRMIDPVCVQSPADAERILALGARRETVKIFGNTKMDLSPPSADTGLEARSALKTLGVPDNARILLGGSVWPGEDEVLCRVYKALRKKHPSLFLVLVPRHVEYCDAVTRTVERLGLSFALRSAPVEKSSGCPDVFVVDTTGELMNFYAVSDLVFVGKSLCEHGGQNPIEPALFGKAVITGPNMENFTGVMSDFLEADAVRQVKDARALEDTADRLLADPAERERLGQAACEAIDRYRGVLSKTVEAVGS